MLDKRSYNPQDDAARADAVKKNLSSDQLGLVEEAEEDHKRIAALEDYFKSSAYNFSAIPCPRKLESTKV